MFVSFHDYGGVSINSVDLIFFIFYLLVVWFSALLGVYC